MKHVRYGLLILLCIVSSLAVFAQTGDEWAFTSQTLVTDIKISSQIELEQQKSGGELTYVKTDLAFRPLDTWRQTITSMDTSPKATIKDDSLQYKWSYPEANAKLLYQVRAQVETQYGLRRVNDKVGFPLSKEDIKGYEKYLQFTENIDKNDEIVEVAQLLAEGEDDLYSLVFKVSEWVKGNVNYNLSFSESLEKPSATIASRQGVCDEITALWVSLLRVLGVPTKYVSGYAYTNLRTPAGFGPHAWGEVYFPGTGWVPFDITYNEFGYVDASHIKLKESFDSGGYSAKYEWRGRDVHLTASPLDFDAEVAEIGDPIDNRVSLRAHFVKEEVGFGSYNMLQVKVTNLNNYYTGITVYSTLSTEMEFLDGNSRDLLLEPYESRDIYWVTKLSEDLDPNYSYLIPTRVYLNDGITQEANFTATSRNKVYSREEVEALTDVTQLAKEKKYSRNINLECTLDNEAAYIDKSTAINCAVENTGNVALEELSVCKKEECTTIDLPIAGEKSVSFKETFTVAGEEEVLIVAKNAKVSKAATVRFQVYGEPKLAIATINHPDATVFNERFKVDFLIKKAADTPVSDVTVTLMHENYERTWEVPTITVDRRFLIDLNGHNLNPGENTFTVELTYNDLAGNLIVEKDSFSVMLENTTLSQRLWINTEKIGRDLSKFDLKVLVLFAFAVGGLIGFALHGFRKLRTYHRSRKKKKEEKELNDDEQLEDQMEAAVFEVLEENERLHQRVEELEGNEEEKPKKKSEKKEKDDKELAPPKKKKKHNSKDVISDMGKKLEKNLKSEFERMQDESEKLKKKE